jgi:hypothetical protein
LEYSAADLAALQVRFNYIFRTIDDVFILVQRHTLHRRRVLTEVESIGGPENDIFGASVIGRQP